MALSARPHDATATRPRSLQLQFQIRTQSAAECSEHLLHAVGIGGALQPEVLPVDIEGDEPADVAGFRDRLTDRAQTAHRNAPGRAFRSEPREHVAVEDDGRCVASRHSAGEYATCFVLRAQRMPNHLATLEITRCSLLSGVTVNFSIETTAGRSPTCCSFSSRRSRSAALSGSGASSG